MSSNHNSTPTPLGPGLNTSLSSLHSLALRRPTVSFQPLAASLQRLEFQSSHPDIKLARNSFKIKARQLLDRHTHHILRSLALSEFREGSRLSQVEGRCFSSAAVTIQMTPYRLCAFCIPDDLAGRRLTRAMSCVRLQHQATGSERKSNGEEKANRYTWKLENP
jgi:hypothetical protein